MLDLTIILAAANETDITKILIGAVFVLIWIAGQAMAALARRKPEGQRRRRLRDQIGGGSATATIPQQRHVPQPRRASPARVSTSTPTPMRVQQKPQRVKHSPVKLPPPIPRSATKAFNTSAAIEQSATLSRAPVSPTAAQRIPVTANATAVRAWLRPTTLRQQFILTELFQPPLALRDPDSARRL